MSVSDQMVQSVCVCSALVPMILVAYAFLDHALAPRWPRVLRVVQVAVVLQMVLVPGELHTRITSMLMGTAFPMIFYAGDLRGRLLTTSLLLVSIRTSEMMGVSAWMFLTGDASSQSIVASWANYPAHVASSLFAAAVLGALLWAFARQLESVRARLRGRVMALVGFLAAQAAALLFLGNAVMRDSPANAPLFWATAAVCLLCVLADIEAFRVAGRLREREEGLRRARELGAAVDELAERARREMEAMSQTAMLRHDARNHVQVLRALIDGGDEAEALEYARELARSWRSGEKDGDGPDA